MFDVNRIIEDYNSGIKMVDLAIKYNTSRSTISRILKKNNVEIYIDKILPPSKEELSNMYEEYGMTISKLARYYNTSNPTVRKWLVSYGIERKSHLEASRQANKIKTSEMPSKNEFEKMYENMSILNLATFYKVGQPIIYEWMEIYGIERKTLSEATKSGKNKQYSDIQFTKEYILENYDDNKSLQHFADKTGISVSHVKKLFKTHSINVKVKWRSSAEINLYEYLKSEYVNQYWDHSNKTLIYPYELDIVDYKNKIAIEYCGIYWHSETFGNKTPNYHYEKYKKCKELGYRLITIFENDDMNKIKSFFKNLYGSNKKIYGRNSIIKEISSEESKKFLEKYHMSGSTGSTYRYGLFYNNELYMVMTFGKSRYNKKIEYEIIRMATKEGYNVIGGASKIFKKFVKDYDVRSCVTYSDLRFGDGNVYINMGFSKIGVSKPNYKYFYKSNNNKLYSRVKFQKHKLKSILPNYDQNKTEYDNMVFNGWGRIWDCGNNVYEWYK